MKTADRIDAHVGSRVRIRRLLMGISQDQLARSLGLTFQQVQKYEKGLNRISAGRLYHIAQILLVPVSYFYEGLPETCENTNHSLATQRAARLEGFLTTAEGHSLVSSFVRIEDSPTRRRIVELVNSLIADAS